MHPSARTRTDPHCTASDLDSLARKGMVERIGQTKDLAGFPIYGVTGCLRSIRARMLSSCPSMHSERPKETANSTRRRVFRLGRHGCQLDATPGVLQLPVQPCVMQPAVVSTRTRRCQGDMMGVWEKTSYQCSGHSRGSRERSSRADSRLRAFPLISRGLAKAHTRRARPSCSSRRGSSLRRAGSSRGSKAHRTSFVGRRGRPRGRG